MINLFKKSKATVFTDLEKYQQIIEYGVINLADINLGRERQFPKEWGQMLDEIFSADIVCAVIGKAERVIIKAVKNPQLYEELKRGKGIKDATIDAIYVAREETADRMKAKFQSLAPASH